jgi:hypothetical protein
MTHCAAQRSSTCDTVVAAADVVTGAVVQHPTGDRRPFCVTAVDFIDVAFPSRCHDDDDGDGEDAVTVEHVRVSGFDLATGDAVVHLGQPFALLCPAFTMTLQAVVAVAAAGAAAPALLVLDDGCGGVSNDMALPRALLAALPRVADAIGAGRAVVATVVACCGVEGVVAVRADAAADDDFDLCA